MENISNLIDKYTGKEQGEPTVGYTCRISHSAKIKLLHLSGHIGVKRTRLAGEILDAGINEAFDQIFDDMDDDQKEDYYRDMQEYEQSQSYR